MEQSSAINRPIPVYIFLRKNTLALDLIGPAEVLRFANRLAEKRAEPPLFDLRYISAESRIDTSIGLSVTGRIRQRRRHRRHRSHLACAGANRRLSISSGGRTDHGHLYAGQR